MVQICGGMIVVCMKKLLFLMLLCFFEATDFQNEIRVRDNQITRLEKTVHRLELSYGNHLQHSAKYTTIIERDDRRSLENEADIKRHLREDH